MNKRYFLWLAVLSCGFIGSLFVFKLLNTEDQPLNIVDINALQNGDAVGTKSLNPVTKRPFKNIQQGGSKSKSDGEAVKAIASALSEAVTSRDDDRLPSLDDAKSADLLALKSRFGSTGVSDIKYDRLGQVRAIYDSIATGSFDYKDNVATGEAISAIGETHKALFGLGAEGVVTGTKVSCADDICATKLRKSFYGLPAWDHEQTVSTKEHTIFGITGVFVEPRLAAPRSYVSDENNFRIAIAKHFSVGSDSVEFDKAAELGIARLGTVDYYAFRLENVSVGGAPYEVFVDAESGNVAKASTLVYESAVSASGTALDDSTVSFQAMQNGSSYQMIDSRFPLGYKTYVYDLSSDSVDLIESDSPSSGWPASAVSVLEFTKVSIDYFKESHNYDAIDPSGSDLFIGVNLDEEKASFNSFENAMIIGTGTGYVAKSGLSFAGAKDVVGHEITHGIVAGSSNLQYRYQSGALNESFSDFFGSMIDGGDWYVGEDLLSPSGKPLRNMANPKDALPPQPSHYSEYKSLPYSFDYGGVHINSGIPNRALYLLAEGLSNETLGASIGREKAADLTFKTMIGLTPNADFDEAAERMINLARTEYANEPAVYDATVLAWQSVGLPQSTITKSSVSNAVVSSKDVTAVAYLKPYYAVADVTPDDNYYTVSVQAFLNSNPEFNAEDNISLVTDQYSKNTRPVLVNLSDDQMALIYQRKVDNSFYLWSGASEVETLIDDGSNIAGLDGSNSSEVIAFSLKNTNIIATLNSGEVVTHEIVMPSTAENVAGQPVTYIDVVRFDPTGRYVAFDFFVCGFEEANCSTFDNGYWSIGILDVMSGLVEFPFPSQPARFDVGFPAFSNLTDQYITLDLVEYTEDEGVNSGVYIYDRRTGDATWVASTDGATEKEGAYGYPSFSSDDSSIVYSVTFDDFEGMYNVLLDDYALRDVETPVSLLNPSVSFKSYAAALPASSNVPSLSLSKSSLDFGDVIRVADKSLQLCLENKGSFPIDIYDSTMPTGFKWDGDNRIISEGESVCSPVTVSSASRELGSFDTTFSIVHNGANSPTPVSVSGIVDIDTDLDGIANNKDADDDGDDVADGLDAFPLDAAESLDSDSDGVGNNADAFPLDASWSGDVDDDGMPDSWESQYGLDADDVRYDADNDLDGDGISNLDEFTAGSDPTRDELPPVLVIPEDITLSAVGRLTGVNLGTATATDNKDGVLTPVASSSGPFQSGQFEIVWTISDAAGNVSKDSQMLTVFPLINLGPSSFVVEDSTLEVAIALSGLAPVYPVIIPVTIGGSASLGADFTVSGEQIVVADGKDGSLTISILADTESDAQETISVTLGEPTNASLGAISQRTLTIIEGNVAPQLNLSVSQGGEPTRTVYADGGTVSVTANYTDLNVGDSQMLSWDTGVWASAAGLVPEFTFSGLAVSFEPAGLSEMTFPISATVTDNGNPVLETSKTVAIKLLGVMPTLDAVADSDGDGISDAAEGFGDSDDDGIPDYKDNISESYLAPMAGDSNRVMQAPVGTKITLGNSAFEAGDDSIGISEDALADIVGSADDDYNYPGGLYDFSVTGAQAGDSYRLVFPLASAVPENGIFRKYIDTNIGWQDFVITANNSIATALASDDACPEPGSSLYVSGLKAGDTCIELLIEDGGANDSDGAADGTVTDPSGLAVLYFGPPSSSSTIILSAAEIEANGSDTVTVTVTATDSDGRLLEGLRVTATASINDVSIGAFIDGGEGIYTATVTAGNTAGGLTIAASIDDGSSNITITSSSMTLKQRTVSSSNQGSSAASSSGGGGCTVGVNNSPDASLMLLMLLALLVSMRRKLVTKKINVPD